MDIKIKRCKFFTQMFWCYNGYKCYAINNQIIVDIQAYIEWFSLKWMKKSNNEFHLICLKDKYAFKSPRRCRIEKKMVATTLKIYWGFSTILDIFLLVSLNTGGWITEPYWPIISRSIDTSLLGLTWSDR